VAELPRNAAGKVLKHEVIRLAGRDERGPVSSQERC
jgi:hypothetical protein